MRRMNPYAVAALVCGLLWACWLGSLLAVVFGHLALRQIARRDERGRGLALAGLVVGYLSLLFLVLTLLLQGGLWVAPASTDL
ncbi:DUF4190 domain-containing protein [Actinocorallia sp. A-T 12471]|uniref:DUF4190 domain-containing protein n=1 Tax=Actinocorallia sp. A-T 12471 TaxID=3089813 RepID=UPI0029CC8554|nr:DUF4190 domain-containing protein [Actinocorallia sp. A-T 12471]MDX6742710.1 DUF4190 domain-containing protein [Actinocorallia sp. A-T 12471]